MPPDVVPPAAPIVVLQGWVPLIGLVVALLAPLGPAIFGVWMANHNAARVRLAAEKVATNLVAVDARTAQKLDDIHILVNARLSAALEKIDELERRLFEVDGTPPSGELPFNPPTDP